MFGTRRIFILLTVSLADCRPSCNVSTSLSHPLSRSLFPSFSLSSSLALSLWHPLPLGSVQHNQFLINSNHPASHKYRIRLSLCARFMCLWRVAAAIWTFLIWIFLLGASIALSTLCHLPPSFHILCLFPSCCCRQTLSLAAKTKNQTTHSQHFRARRRSVSATVCLPAKKCAAPCERVCNHIHNNNHHHHTHRQTRTLLPLLWPTSWFMRRWQLSKFNYKAALWGAQNERKIDKQWKLNCTFCSVSQGLAGFACWQPAKGFSYCGGTWVCVRVWRLHLWLVVPPRTTLKNLLTK